ncbi:hypothetical protein [Paenibacillus cymbidii]|uniref:hypothetical protein n=1 Tax=Paenibacillus cymbidii TaxID=1639034 RepID=UPI0038B25963
MIYLAEEAAAASEPSKFDTFDVFIIVFTIIIAIGVFRSLGAREKNKFAIAVGVVSLLVFLFLDFVMVKNWLGLL